MDADGPLAAFEVRELLDVREAREPVGVRPVRTGGVRRTQEFLDVEDATRRRVLVPTDPTVKVSTTLFSLRSFRLCFAPETITRYGFGATDTWLACTQPVLLFGRIGRYT